MQRLTNQKMSKFYAYIPDEDGAEPKVLMGNKRKTPGRYYFMVRGDNAHHKAHKRAQSKFRDIAGSYKLFEYWDIRQRDKYKEI